MNLTWSIGAVRITRVVESVSPVAPNALFPEVATADIERHESWLKPHFVDADGNLLLSIHGLIVESGEQRILVDTCVGEKPIPGFEGMGEGSRFLEDLEGAGFSAESIDVVLCTHLHFDHVGWNTRLEGDRWVPTFPNARYLFAREEYEHWSGSAARDFAPTFDTAVEPVLEAGLADLVETDHRLTPEIRLEATPGHTPGHVAVLIESGDARAMITGDLTHHPVQWAEVDWKMGADSDSAEAARTRQRLLQEYADGDLLVIGTHYAEPCSGRLVGDGQGGHRFEAAPR